MLPTLYLVRHGLTVDDSPSGVKDRVSSWKDVPITKQGREQAQNTGEELADKGIECVYCSDLARAHETAKIICAAIGCSELQPSMDFRPWNLGDFTGQESAAVKEVLKDYINEPDRKVPGGESFSQYSSRLFAGLEPLLEEIEEGATYALVTHSWNCRTIDAWIKAGARPDHALDDSAFADDAQPTASTAQITHEGGKWDISRAEEAIPESPVKSVGSISDAEQARVLRDKALSQWR